MKKILSVFFILSFHLCYSQREKTYFVDIDKYNTCCLSLYNNGKYDLAIEEVHEDVLGTLIFSSGKYHVDRNNITLEDNEYKFKLVYHDSANSIIPIKTFVFLLNKKLKPTKFINYSDISLDSKKLDGKIYSFVNIQVKRPVKFITSGVYVDSIYRDGYNNLPSDFNFKLELLKNHQFRFYIPNLLVLKGNWSQNDSSLVLYDSNLNHQFRLIISDDDKVIHNFSRFNFFADNRLFLVK